MDELQKTLISFGAIIIIGILIYMGTIYYLKLTKKMKNNKMLSMNLVIKYKLFLEYLAFQEERKENYFTFLIKIDNLNLLENMYEDQTIKNYLTYIVKELSVYLPFGGKVAQTPNRDTFIMYYPALNDDPYLLGKQFKMLAEKSFHEGGIHISQTSSVASIDSNELSKLSYALIDAVRSLGEPTVFDERLHIQSDEFIRLVQDTKALNFKLNSYQVESKAAKQIKEIYNEVYMNDVSFKNFLSKIIAADQAWVNMHIIAYILGKMNQNNTYAQVSIPVLLVTIEKAYFMDQLETLVKGNQFLMENIILSIKLTQVSNEEQIIKHMLTLNNLGVKISMQIDEIDQHIYNNIQKYHIKRLEISDQLINHEMIADLLYFAKVNHMEVLYKTHQKNVDPEALNVTHVTMDVISLTSAKQKRGRR